MAGTPSAQHVEGRTLDPLPTLHASELVLRTTDRAYHDIRRLANILGHVTLDSRREDLLDYIRPNRARFLKAYALISWLSGNHGELVVNASNALAEARSQREQIDTCQDQLFFMHGGLFSARQRQYDVPVAVDVLVGGQYPHLPKGIPYCGGDIDPRPIFKLSADREEIVLRANRAMRLALLKSGGIPDQFTSYDVRSGVLTLTVDGEFELMVTLTTEREDAKWTLLKVTVNVKAREGESITAPAADFRQQSYLQEVVQRAMDVHATADATLPRPNPLLAAYQVCHDMCCSMVLEILHAQAHKLATRVGGLWATQLVVKFHRESQVLDLCLWHREFSAGLGGTGRDVGVGVTGTGETPPRRQQAATSSRFKGADVASLPPLPTGCRYVRVHRPVDRNSQIVASLGPTEELLKDNVGGGGDFNQPEAGTIIGEATSTNNTPTSSVPVHPDKLSCAQMLLAAARTFASHKIKTLVSDIERVSAQLGTVPRVTSLGGLSARICPWGGGTLEVAVDMKSGRFLVADTSGSGGKAMAGCVARLREALNLLPRTDSHSLGETVAATLSAGRSVLQKPSPSIESARHGERQDLRQQQVRRCMGESFGRLRRGEVEHTFKRALGMVPHVRWQALLGRTDVSVKDAGDGFSHFDSGGTLRTSVRLSQFRENGVTMSENWRRRTRSYRISRAGTSAIELTPAERAATLGQVTTAGPAGVGLDLGGFGPTDSWHRGGTLPALAASLAEVSDGGDAPNAQDVETPQNGNVLNDTGEVLSFFLEVGITGSLDVEHTVISSAVPTAGRSRNSLRQVVGETYQLFPCQPLSGLPCGSLEAALLPSEPPPVLGTKRAGSCLEERDIGRENGIAGGMDDVVDHIGFCRTKFDTVTNLAMEATQAQLRTAVQMYHRLVPFARLQHGLLKVGTGLSLDFRELTHFSRTQQEVPHCPVFLAGEHGWSSPEVAATSARVTFHAGHTQADTWEWDIVLGPTSSLIDHVGTDLTKGDSATSAAREVVNQHLPLVQHFEIGGQNRLGHVEGHEGGDRFPGKYVKIRFPRQFSVHTMCRSFALAGEGLAAMHTLAAQATTLLQGKSEGAGYRVVSCSPIHVAMQDAGLDHVVLLTHSAFSARHISSAEQPGLVLIPCPHVTTCPAAMRELEASVRKHRDLNALLHGLSRTVAILAVVVSVVPGVGVASGVHGDRSAAGGGVVLTAISPARFLLSMTSLKNRRDGSWLQPKPPLTLGVEAGGKVRVSRVGEKDVVAGTGALRDLLLEWIAPSRE